VQEGIVTVKALLLGIKPQLYGQLISILGRENIDGNIAQNLNQAQLFINNYNFYVTIIDGTLPWAFEAIVMIKARHILAPIVILNAEKKNIAKFYQMGVNSVMENDIDWDIFAAIVFGLIMSFQMTLNSKSQSEVYTTLVRILDMKDSLTKGHGIRVAQLAVDIYDYSGYIDFEDREVLRIGCLLHDVGKIGVPDYILKSNHSLDSDEISNIQNHPQYGVEMVKTLITDEKILDIILHHHEKLDGSGYPDRLMGDKISHLVRIATLSDVYDALTHRRTYREESNPKEALFTIETAFVDTGKISRFFFDKLIHMISMD
jgi:putative nucleotidyltransferase with HDIG domain